MQEEEIKQDAAGIDVEGNDEKKSIASEKSKISRADRSSESKSRPDKLYKKHIYFNEEEREKNQRNQSDELELVVMDQDAEELSFHGKKLKVHKDFRLVLILQDGHTKVPKFLLEKVMLINNKLSHEGTWKDLVSDMLMNYCFPGDKETSIAKQIFQREAFP